MTDGLSEVFAGTYFNRRRKHYYICPCGWRAEIKYIPEKKRYNYDVAEQHKQECPLP